MSNLQLTNVLSMKSKNYYSKQWPSCIYYSLSPHCLGNSLTSNFKVATGTLVNNRQYNMCILIVRLPNLCYYILKTVCFRWNICAYDVLWLRHIPNNNDLSFSLFSIRNAHTPFTEIKLTATFVCYVRKFILWKTAMNGWWLNTI